MNFSNINKALFAWVKSAVAGVSGVTVFWETGDPNAPKPNPPSVKLSWLTGPTMLGLDELRPTAANPDAFEIVGSRQMMLSVNAYGSGTDALQILSDLQTSISDPGAMAGLGAVNVSVLRTSPPRDINVATNTRIESRTQMDITLLATERKALPGVTPIEAAELGAEISGIEYTAEIGGE